MTENAEPQPGQSGQLNQRIGYRNLHRYRIISSIVKSQSELTLTLESGVVFRNRQSQYRRTQAAKQQKKKHPREYLSHPAHRT